MKVRLHSMTDLITNSSTVIYTYSDASLDACRNMIDEIFRVSGVDKKCDDVFSLSVALENNDRYHDAAAEMEQEDLPVELRGLSYRDMDKALDAYLDQIALGKVEKPEWMVAAEGGSGGYDYKPSTNLNIVAKAPEYEKLTELVHKFLYSTSHESSYDG